MVFSSPIFLFVFLPVLFLLYTIVPGQKSKNAILLVFSLIFYAFGQPEYVLLLLLSITCNYLFGLALGGCGKNRRAVITAAVIANIALLAVFKYLDFGTEIINGLFGLSLPLTKIALPIGISFYTFQGMSYVIDVYRDKTQCAKNFAKLALYISMFPQLIAGPIIKYHDVSEQIDSRESTPKMTAEGIRRFIIGMSKKLLIADLLATVCDRAFSLGAGEIALPIAWLGAICYCLQIYFDFSGYSDMAIGLGKMFGFNFKENFNYPYSAGTMKEFWRRWHMSLSYWFRDYLYIPLGGSRKGKARECLNKMIVFALTGLWHGASWNFVIWGLWHGVFVTGETLAARLIKKIRSGLTGRIVYRTLTLLVVIVGFVVFRAETLSSAWEMICAMFSGPLDTREGALALAETLNPLSIGVLVLAVLASAPLLPCALSRLEAGSQTAMRRIQAIGYAAAVVLLVLSIMNMAASEFSPFIYYRF